MLKELLFVGAVVILSIIVCGIAIVVVITTEPGSVHDEPGY